MPKVKTVKRHRELAAHKRTPGDIRAQVTVPVSRRLLDRIVAAGWCTADDLKNDEILVAAVWAWLERDRQMFEIMLRASRTPRLSTREIADMQRDLAAEVKDIKFG